MTRPYPNLFDFEPTPPHGMGKTQVPTGDDPVFAAEPDPLAPPPVEMDTEFDLFRDEQTNPDPAPVESCDFPAPRHVSDTGTPREIPAMRHIPVPPPPSFLRRYWFPLAFGSALCLSMAIMVYCVSMPAPMVEDAIATGKARFECSVEPAGGKAARMVTAYSCPRGGNLCCDNAGGCSVWTTKADGQVRDWGFIAGGQCVEINNLYRRVTPAVRAVAEMEVGP